MRLNSKTRTLAGNIRLISIAVLQVAAFGASAQALDPPALDLPGKASDTAGDSCCASLVLRCQRDAAAPTTTAADRVAIANEQTKQRLDGRRTSPSSNPNDVDSVVVTADRAEEGQWQQFGDEIDQAVTPDCVTVGSSSGLLALPLMAIMAADGACR
jgi:hypothetical protein